MKISLWSANHLVVRLITSSLFTSLIQAQNSYYAFRQRYISADGALDIAIGFDFGGCESVCLAIVDCEEFLYGKDSVNYGYCYYVNFLDGASYTLQHDIDAASYLYLNNKFGLDPSAYIDAYTCTSLTCKTCLPELGLYYGNSNPPSSTCLKAPVPTSQDPNAALTINGVTEVDPQTGNPVCNTGFYHGATSSICIPSLYSNATVFDLSGTILNCNPGFYLSSDSSICIRCEDKNAVRCPIFDIYQLSENCIDGFYAVYTYTSSLRKRKAPGNLFYLCTATCLDINARNCDYSRGFALSCKSNYYLNSTGVCEICFDSKADTCSVDSSQSCIAGYYIGTGTTCSSCIDTLSLVCDQSSGLAITCLPGNYLLNNKCTACGGNIATCNRLSGVAITCLSGFGGIDCSIDLNAKSSSSSSIASSTSASVSSSSIISSSSVTSSDSSTPLSTSSSSISSVSSSSSSTFATSSSVISSTSSPTTLFILPTATSSTTSIRSTGNSISSSISNSISSSISSSRSSSISSSITSSTTITSVNTSASSGAAAIGSAMARLIIAVANGILNAYTVINCRSPSTINRSSAIWTCITS